MNGPRASILVALEREAVVWLSSIRPDGRPHLVPLWFLWDGESIVAFSKPHAQKVANLRADPRVMVAVGQPGTDFDVELIEATAELVAMPTQRLLTDGFARKYADLIARAGNTHERFAAAYSQPIRIHPTRWLGWGGRGWSDTQAHPDNDMASDLYLRVSRPSRGIMTGRRRTSRTGVSTFG